MLTKCRIEKILELVKKEYDYMDNKPIYINTNYKGIWGAETTRFDYTLKVGKNFNDDDFIPFYYEYLAKEFKFDLTWAEVDYQNTMNALVVLHEIGHMQQTMDMNIELIESWAEEMHLAYNNYRETKKSISKEEQLIAYRKISYEYLADKFAIEIFNKYAVKILAILNGVSQKEIKNRLEEVKKSVA